MSYKVSVNKVIHNCPHCHVELENMLSEAGKNDTCPKCNIDFTVPGAKELEERNRQNERIEEETRAKRVAAEEERKRLKEVDETAAANAMRAGEEAPQEAQARRTIGQGIVPQPPAGNSAWVPEYEGLMACGEIMVAGGVVLILIGVIGGIIIIANNEPISGVGVIVGAILWGILIIGAGRVIYAIRDMAINSFHSSAYLKRLVERG